MVNSLRVMNLLDSSYTPNFFAAGFNAGVIALRYLRSMLHLSRKRRAILGLPLAPGRAPGL
jgi:hypothetical protein